MDLEKLKQQLSVELQSAGTDIPVLKSIARSITQSLETAFWEDAPIRTLVTGRATLIDTLLAHLWKELIPGNAPAALAAVGGYGRGELHPASDIDLLFLVPEGKHTGIEQQISEYITLLWDIGMNVGQSVRSPTICQSEAENDITVITTLMEARLICGDASLLEEMQEAISPKHIWPTDTFFKAKLEEQRQRYRKHDETAHNLEPNLKEGPGGLRDIQMIGWVLKRHFGATSLSELVNHGFLTEHECKSIINGLEHLWKIRFALHTLTGREEDRLLFDLQQKLAEKFEHVDNIANLAVEQFMQRYYRTITRLQRLNEMLLQHFEESIVMKNRLGTPVPINRRFQVTNGYIEVTDKQIFSHRPESMLELFLMMTQHSEIRGIRASTIRLIHQHLHLIDRTFRNDPKAKKLFIALVRQPLGVYRALRSMNRYGILARYIPAFANIVGRMQFDLFHVYTVDTHTLFLIRNLRRFTVDALHHEFPLCSDVMQTIEQQETLILAGLFHDIAKGRGGDHSQLGAVDALAFCREHGLPEAQCELIAWLVRNHLIMSMTAQRKDIEDPDVIREFAEHVMDTNRLKHLYLLTVCDMRATNPKRWNGWKDSLLKQLYQSTYKLLTSPGKAVDSLQAIQDKQASVRQALAQQDQDAITKLWMQFSTDYFLNHTQEEIEWHTEVMLSSEEKNYPLVRIRREVKHGASEILVIDWDRDNFFAINAWVLDQCALNIVQARLETTDDGKAINSFSVLEEDGSPIHGQMREEEVRERILDGLATLTEPPEYTRYVQRQLKYFDIPTSVVISQDTSNRRTILRLRTADRPGLLSRVGYAFSQARVRLLNAMIGTIGETAEDTFLIVDRNNEAITDKQTLEQIESLLLEQLSSHETSDQQQQAAP